MLDLAAIPVLQSDNPMTPPRRRLYFDNAATSYPKPPAVYDAVDHYQREVGVAVGRGNSRMATQLQARVDACRARAARLLGAPTAESVIFAFNGTDALHLAIDGVLAPGDHVVTTMLEHNSVLRPLRARQNEGTLDVTYVGVSEEGTVSVDELRQALRPETKLVIVTHASNVTGAIQPVEEIAQAVRDHDGFLLVDAAQTAGHLPIDVKGWGIDLLACSGHKGLLGPLGTGILVVGERAGDVLRPVRLGGTGTQSESDVQPTKLPYRLESGNHNAPGLCGLEASLAWIEERGIASLREHEQRLTSMMLDGLRRFPQITLYGPTEAEARVGVASVTLPGLDPHMLGTILEQQFGIETRAGLHCAPLTHETLGTKESGGTLRLSTGPFLTESDVDEMLEAIFQLVVATH